jgi:hypothetical protein
MVSLVWPRIQLTRIELFIAKSAPNNPFRPVGASPFFTESLERLAGDR